MEALLIQAAAAKRAALMLSTVGESQKNQALARMADCIDQDRNAILKANQKDIANAREKNLKESFIERLTLDDKRIDAMRAGLAKVAALADPVGQVLSGWTRPNGLRVVKRRVPLGVVGIIYESRPNVTVDAAALCIKSGNAAVLRGGSDAIFSNTALMNALARGAGEAGLPEGCVSLVTDTGRETAQRLMQLNEYIDVLIPRGGKGLIDSVVKNASIPVIQTGDGICHVYVDRECDLEMGLSIAVSAKISRPSVCNSAETLLVHRDIAQSFLPRCLEMLKAEGVQVRGCERAQAYSKEVVPAAEEDYHTEYNQLIYNVRVVDGLCQAIEHINTYGTRHSEAIVTGSLARAARFQDEVDAAAVYVNASTRFTDGEEFGFGAEIGISNQKLHARGPMGLEELTTYKYLITGDGQIR